MNKSAPPTAALPIADCPFCAEDMILFKKVSPGTAGYFMCLDCGAHTGTCINEAEALIQWNRRAPAVQATADADEAINDLKHIHDRMVTLVSPKLTCKEAYEHGAMDAGAMLFEYIQSRVRQRKAVSPKAAAE